MILYAGLIRSTSVDTNPHYEFIGFFLIHCNFIEIMFRIVQVCQGCYSWWISGSDTGIISLRLCSGSYRSVKGSHPDDFRIESWNNFIEIMFRIVLVCQGCYSWWISGSDPEIISLILNTVVIRMAIILLLGHKKMSRIFIATHFS